MRKSPIAVLTTVLTVSAFVVWLAPTAAGSAPGGARPRVTIASFEPESGTNRPESVVTLDAVDADGVIMEVRVLWGDRTVSFADTFCLQGTDPGTPAHLIIGHTYGKTGHFRIQVEASSVQQCPWVAPPGIEQHPSPKVLPVVITDPGVLPPA